MTVRKTHSQSPLPPRKKTMSFFEALRRVRTGRKATRLSWGNEQDYLIIHDEILNVHKSEDNTLHPLLVSIGDMDADDWVVL